MRELNHPLKFQLLSKSWGLQLPTVGFSEVTVSEAIYVNLQIIFCTDTVIFHYTTLFHFQLIAVGLC